MSAYWENTLDQTYENWLRKAKKIARQMKKLKHIEKTIHTIEFKLHELKKKSKGANTEMVGI